MNPNWQQLNPEVIGKRMEEGFLDQFKKMDDTGFERFKKRFPELTPLLRMLYWKAKHDPEYEIDYSDIQELVAKQFAYDRAKQMKDMAMHAGDLLLDKLSVNDMKEVSVDKTFIDEFKALEVEAADVERRAKAVQKQSADLWRRFNEQYKAQHKDAVAFTFREGKFFAVSEDEAEKFASEMGLL